MFRRMTESESKVPRATTRGAGGVALALRGGGAHGAFFWGVLDRLLEGGLEVEAISGVSSGAISGAILAQGMASGGPALARAELRLFWERLGSGAGPGPLGAWLWAADMLGAFAWQGMETMLRHFAPAQINPMGHNPLRPLLAATLDPTRLKARGAPRLFVAATDVLSGEPVVFGNDEVTVDVLLASACVPLIFTAVEIGGRAYWDGGCAGNPPLAPLVAPRPPRELVVIRAHPVRRRTLPQSQAEIINRLNEIACHNVLQAELALMPPQCRVRIFDADDALGHLPLSSKFRADRSVLRALFAAGRAAVEAQEAAQAAA